MNNKESLKSILTFWQQIIADEEIPVQNRMKASELLYRSLQQDEELPEQKNRQQIEADIARRIKLSEAIISKYSKTIRKGASDV